MQNNINSTFKIIQKPKVFKLQHMFKTSKKSSVQEFPYGVFNNYMMKYNTQASMVIFHNLHKDLEEEEKYGNNIQEQEKCNFVWA